MIWLLALACVVTSGSEPVERDTATQDSALPTDTDTDTDTAAVTGLEDVPFEDGDPERGLALFETHCVDCHGVDGDRIPPPLSYEVPALSPQEAAEQIRFGGGKMPAIDVDGPEIADLVAYLFERWGEPGDTGVSR